MKQSQPQFMMICLCAVASTICSELSGVILNRETTMKENDFLYLRFIEQYHPRYSSDDRVLWCDILFRYLDENEEVSEDDLEWIHNDIGNKEEVLQELKRLEVELFSEALDNFYKKLWK